MNVINLFATMVVLFFLSGCSTNSLKDNSILYQKESSILKVKPKGLPSIYSCNYNSNSKNSGSFYKTDGPLEIPLNIDDVLEPIPIFEPLHKWANRPYNVFKQDFIPITQLGNFKQKGVGTWYGRRYHGKKTSSGELYDMFEMTAASPILPIPSYARVTNLKNGRSVVVRINDRGPFLKGRIIDLSFLSACRLDYAIQGSAEVEVVSLLPEKNN